MKNHDFLKFSNIVDFEDRDVRKIFEYQKIPDILGLLIIHALFTKQTITWLARCFEKFFFLKNEYFRKNHDFPEFLKIADRTSTGISIKNGAGPMYACKSGSF